MKFLIFPTIFGDVIHGPVRKLSTMFTMGYRDVARNVAFVLQTRCHGNKYPRLESTRGVVVWPRGSNNVSTFLQKGGIDSRSAVDPCQCRGFAFFDKLRRSQSDFCNRRSKRLNIFSVGKFFKHDATVDKRFARGLKS